MKMFSIIIIMTKHQSYRLNIQIYPDILYLFYYVFISYVQHFIYK